MSKLLAVDPGVRGCGVAFFNGDILLNATYIENPFFTGSRVREAVHLAHAVSTWAFTKGLYFDLAVEVPRVYPAARQKGDQNDLIAVAGVAFAVGAKTAGFITTYYPREWKGTIDPDAMIERIKGRLSPAEKHRILTVKKSLMHNVYDAIGIGLKKLGRLEPHRVISRGQ